MARNALLVSALLALVALPSSALADKKEEAKAYVTLAKAAFGKGKFSQCAEHFGSAYQLDPLPKYLFNVGLCHEKGEDLEQALAAYKRYLRVAPKGDKAGEAGTRAELLELKLQAERQKQLEAERKKEQEAERRNDDAAARAERQKQAEAEFQKKEAERQKQLEAERQRRIAEENKNALGLLKGTPQSPEKRVAASSPRPTAKRRSSRSKSSIYGSKFRERDPHLRLGIGFGTQGDDENALPLAKLSFRGQFPLGSYMEKNPNSIAFGIDMIYSAIEGFTPMSLAFRYNVPMLGLRPYAEIMAGMQIETENDEPSATIGLDLPLRLGVELPIGFHAIGAEFNVRPLDGTNGISVSYTFNFI